MTNHLRHPELNGSPYFLEGGEPSVLLIHGFNTTTAEMRPLGDHLHVAGLTVSAPLLPGHGTHPADLNRVSWQDWYACVDAAYNNLSQRSEQVWVGGQSMGALLALLLAARHPGAKGLLLYSPAFQARFARIGAFLQFLTPWIKKEPVLKDVGLQGYDVYPTKGLAQLCELQRVARGEVTRVSQPTLIVMGNRDLIVPARVRSYLMDTLNSRVKELVVLKGSTHGVLLAGQQAEANAAALDFIRENSA